MFRNLLKPDSPLMITMSQVTDCIFLSLFWLLGCFPVVTMGASFAALYDASFRAFRQGDKHSWQRFLEVYRGNWKQSIVPTLVFLTLFWAIGWALIQVWNQAVYGLLSWGFFAAAAVLGAFLLGILGILFPLLSRFENPTVMLLKNTLLLALANAPGTLALGILNSITILACARWVFPLFFLPALASLISSLLLEPMFRPYMPEE